MTDPVDAIIHERKNTHGGYDLQSYLYSRLKAAMRERERFTVNPITATQEQSLDMICLKLSRILAGDATFKDHWDDIAGYAKIANGMLPPVDSKLVEAVNNLIAVARPFMTDEPQRLALKLVEEAIKGVK